MSASFRSMGMLLAGLLLAASVDGARPQGTPPPAAPAEPPAKNDTVHGYAKSNLDCLAWSNGCVICARDEKGAAHCSTPGIACIPAEVTCKVSKGQ